jgi:hypothetical protein
MMAVCCTKPDEFTDPHVGNVVAVRVFQEEYVGLLSDIGAPVPELKTSWLM